MNTVMTNLSQGLQRVSGALDELAHFQDPYMMAPCGHSIDQSMMQELFGGLNETHSCRREEKCPQCFTIVTHCYPNHALKDIAERVQAIVSMEVCSAVVPSSTLLSSVVSFGAEDWQRYFGDIGEVPPLPATIVPRLESACPYFPGKKVKDTHLLVLIPATVNGEPFTLKTLRMLIKSPKEGGHATDYCYLDTDVDAQYGDQPVAASHWVLMTKKVIPGSRNQTFAAQSALLKPSYQVPDLVSATTCIAMRYVKTGKRLFSDSPRTYTRCAQFVSVSVDGNCCQTAVGGFDSSGLYVMYVNVVHDCIGLAALAEVL